MSVIRIAHLSDLHFKPGKRDGRVWEQVRDFLNGTVRPHAVLITGDVTDSATAAEFDCARARLSELSVHPEGDVEPYRIVAGNHDRFSYRGNALPLVGRALRSWTRDKAGRFDNAFKGARQITADSPADFELPRPGARAAASTRWRIRLVGLDSSAGRQWFAQGHVSASAIADACAKALENADGRDLVIALVHHHLLPIPAVERRKVDSGKLSQLLDATGMLNAGTLLEQLSKSQVDLVLHGHEHAPHHARFAGAGILSTDVAIVGAGSATGDETLRGWQLDRAHFNVFELEEDRSVWLRQVSGSSGALRFEGDRRLALGAEGIRVSRFVRRNRALGDERGHEARSLPESRIRKLVEFRADREVQHTETRTEWHCGAGWSLTTASASGLVGPAIVEFEWDRGGAAPPRLVLPVQAPGKPGQHEFGIDLAEGDQGRVARRVTTRWSWTGSAALTRAELRTLPNAALEGPRASGEEFAAVHCGGEYQELVLSVRLPADFAPPPGRVRAYFDRSGSGSGASPEYSAELSASVDACGPGNFELRVAYPMPGYVYGMSWPVSEKGAGPEGAAEFAAALAAGGPEIARWLGEQLSLGCHGLASRWALYLPDRLPATGLRRVLGDAAAPAALLFNDARGLARAAYFGDAVVVLEDGAGARYEIAEGERMAGYFAVRDTPALELPALAVLRLGFAAEPLAAERERWMGECKSFANLLCLNLASMARRLEGARRQRGTSPTA